MVLLAAAAASAKASERANAAADNAGAQKSAQQGTPLTQSPEVKNARLGTSGAGSAAGVKGADALEEIIVTGVRQSQFRAIQLKRDAPSIQDSISAESIGQLPDVTITDALQRITGVQIDRDAGVGTSVSVRGLPEVGTLLNGEVFISPDQIDSQQPDFTTLPATLFNQVDVIKSPTSAQTETGISGALNLHTYRPWDLPHGFTYSYTADAERGSVSRRTGPAVSGLFAYNADEFDARVGMPGLHTVRPKVEPVERNAVLPREIFSRFANESFWTDPKNNISQVPVV